MSFGFVFVYSGEVYYILGYGWEFIGVIYGCVLFVEYSGFLVLIISIYKLEMFI